VFSGGKEILIFLEKKISKKFRACKRRAGGKKLRGGGPDYFFLFPGARPGWGGRLFFLELVRGERFFRRAGGARFWEKLFGNIWKNRGSRGEFFDFFFFPKTPQIWILQIFSPPPRPFFFFFFNR